MGKKKQAFRELEEDVVNAEEELQAVKWELATAINRTVELSDENDRLCKMIELLEQTVVGQAMALHCRGINDAAEKAVSKVLFDSGAWPR